jgi:CIC family chloride channel protein
MKEANSAASSRRLRWVPELLQLGPRRIGARVRLLGPATLVGIIAGLGAVAFYVATQVVSRYALGRVVGYDPTPHPAGEAELAWLAPASETFLPWLLLLVPALGGLISGVLVFTIAPEAEGHGTDAVIAAYHRGGGYIRPRVPLVKIVASAITIGTGGSGGREGPIAQIGAGFGSFLAGVLRLDAADRRVLLASGMGAGIAAIFRAPLAGALFAAEVLYWSPEFEPEVILPAGLASVVSYCTFGAVFGWKPLFAVPMLEFHEPRQLLPYLLLAVFVVVMAMLYTRTFYAVTHAFHRLRMPNHVKPAIGAFLAGAVGLALYFALGKQASVLAVISFGYGALQDGMDPHTKTTAMVFLAIALGKIVTTSLTIGSGGSGGVFGPSMVIGGCAGGFLCIALRSILPGWTPDLASCVIVGMAGFFAAAAKTPFSTIVIVSEMTGGYDLLLPSLWVCVLAFMLSDRQSIYSSQVESRALSPAHRGTFVRRVLAGITLRKILERAPSPLPLHIDDSLDEIAKRSRESNDDASVLPVVDAENRLLGVVSLRDVQRDSSSAAPRRSHAIADWVRRDVVPLTVEQSLDDAMESFADLEDLSALPVVDDLARRKLRGIARRADVYRMYLELVHGRSAAPTPQRDGE